jgi:hypothetical protein
MELQIWDRPYSDPLDKHAAMAIYGNVPPLARADKRGQWNRLVIKADGRMISAWTNGQLVQQVNTAEHPELKHRHLAGWIGIQEHGAKMRVRNLDVLEAPDGPGLSSLCPPTLEPVTVVLDRLMNPERLSRTRDLDTQTRAVTATVSGDPPEGQVLAQLENGPGVLVRIARTTDEGRLAFYFDGQSQPRWECRPGDLAGRVPHLGDDLNPLLTCLAYSKSLKIVLRGARRGEYRFDYVVFPSTLVSVPSSEPAPKTDLQDEFGIPRGWLSAIAYRQNQLGWGGHREFDPRPRLQSPQKTIGPGKSETLVTLDGAGIVHWTKLQAANRVLDNQDLWLEVRVDGESKPSLAAPARLLFAGLAGQGNWPNFVLVDRNGMTNLLAMPYGKGLSIAAANRGKRPTPAVGLTVSYEPEKGTFYFSGKGADKAEKRPFHFSVSEKVECPLLLLRLRGVFQPAGEPTADLVRLAGPGRWIGLVCDQPQGTPPTTESLVIDSRPADGWSGLSPHLFLGQDGEFRSNLSGRHRSLWWRYLLLEPVDFRQSLVLKSAAPHSVGRLALFYAAK